MIRGPASALVAIVLAASIGLCAPPVDIPRIDMADVVLPLGRQCDASVAAIEADPESAGAWGHYAMVLHANSFASDADTCYAQAQALAPRDFRWTYFRGVLLMKSDPSAAIEHLREAVRLDPSYAAAFIRLGAALRAVDREDEAWAAFDKALELQPSNLSAHIHMGQLELSRGRIEIAIEHLETARRGSRDRANDASVLSALARAHARMGDRELARRLAAASNASKPGAVFDDKRFNAVVYLASRWSEFTARAERLLEGGNAAAAERELLRGLALGHEPAVVHGAVARLNFKSGAWDKCIEAARLAVSEGNEGLVVQYVLGASLTLQGRFAEADAVLAELVAATPDDARSVDMHARVAAGLGDDATALERWDRALELDDTPRTRSRRAGALARLGRSQEAIAEWTGLCESEPGNGDFWIGLGEAHQQAGDLEAARQAYERAVPLVESPRAGRAIVAIDVQRRAWGEALARLETMRRDWPSDPSVINDLAWLLSTCPDDDTRDGARAVTLIEPLVKMTNRRNAAVLDTLAAALAESGRITEARSVMDEALALITGENAAEQRAKYERRRDRYAQGSPWRDEH